MELLALVIINLLFSVILYYGVSIKVTNSLKDHQNKKLSSDINKHLLSIYKETENYMALLDSRIAILSNLLAKAEAKGIHLKDSEFEMTSNQEKIFREEQKQTVAKSPESDRNSAILPSSMLTTGINEMYIKNEIRNVRYAKLEKTLLPVDNENIPE
ncbi:MAG: hypothetical protein K8R21_12465, partial [Leptospira sp.]|nr:hypothetical protein [Leptospira sp.]